jgi:hypothetical protein
MEQFQELGAQGLEVAVIFYFFVILVEQVII